MLKKLSRTTNFILIGIVVGLFVGVSIRQAFGQTDISGTARADNLTVNTSGNAGNGLIVAAGNALVAGDVGIGTTTPTAKLDVVGDIRSTTQLCAGATCVNESELQAMKNQIQTTIAHPGMTFIHFTKIGSGTIKQDGSIIPFQSGETEAGTGWSDDLLPRTVSLVSTPDSGYKFVKWSGGCSGTGDTCSISLQKGGDADINVTMEFASTSVVTTCTGTHPAAGNGVVLNDYTTVVISPYTGPSNTTWGYVSDVVGGPSCTWGCTGLMDRNGDLGCKLPVAGSGVTVKINNLSTGQPFSGINVSPVSVIGLTTTAALGMNGESSGIFTTGTDGKTAEFKFGYMDLVGSWTQIEIKSPGYKIRSADGCTAEVSIYANRQLNHCPGAVNGKSVTINMVPGDISTSPTTHFEKLTYHRGETLKGSITGGDPNDTWGCMDTPITASDRLCNSGRTDAWRQLTVPYDGHADGWQLVETNQGDSIQLGGLLIEQGFPLGTYTQYVKTGQWGTSGQTTSKSITVQ